MDKFPGCDVCRSWSKCNGCGESCRSETSWRNGGMCFTCVVVCLLGGSGAGASCCGSICSEKKIGVGRCVDTVDQQAPDEAQHIPVSLCWPVLFMLILVSLTDKRAEILFFFSNNAVTTSRDTFCFFWDDSFLLLASLSGARKKQNQSVWRCRYIFQISKIIYCLNKDSASCIQLL